MTLCIYDGSPTLGGDPGMSLRDWYAGQVLKGLLSYNGDYSDDARRAVVHVCFSWADAMLAERKKESTP